MRVSTALIQQQGVQSILDKQAELLRIQNQLSTGKRLIAPSDDPSAMSRVIDLNEALNQIGQYDENANYATQRLNLEEATLTSANNVLQRVRELAIQAANTGTNDIESERAIASEIKERLQEIFEYGNTQDAKGDYIFSGFQSKTRSFTTDGVGNYFYNGDEGQLDIQIGANRQAATSDSGASIFQLIRQGNSDFSVDVNRTNAGTGRISTGSVIDTGLFLSNDYTIRFIDADNYEVFNNTTAAVVAPSPRTYNDGGVITFDGIAVEISGTPAANDEFSVNASRYQDIFTTLYDLVRELETPGTGDLTGSFGGAYLANNFVSGEAIGFDLNFDGVTLNIATTTAATDALTAANITTALVAAGVTDNLDGTYTLNGTTPGYSMTFQVNAVTSAIDFRTAGGNGQIFSNLTLSNLTDPGNDDILLLNNNGNTVASSASITSAIVADSSFFASGAPSNSFLSQQIDNALNNIDRAMDNIINVQTRIGGRLNSVESQQADNETKNIALQKIRSEIEDLDFAEAISDMTFQTTALQVAQQTFVRIQGLSLFEYI